MNAPYSQGMAKPIATILKQRIDGWSNLLSGLGVKGKDKRVDIDFTYDPLTEIDAEYLYAADDISSKIVDLLPEDAIREWIELKGFSDQKIEQGVAAKMDSLSARSRLKEGWQWGRLYGGAGVYMTIDDGMDPQEPVNERRIMEVKSLTPLTRYELVPYQINSNLDSPFFGQPEIYRLQTSQPTDFVERYIHHTRLLRFDGVVLPRRLRIQNQWWGDSVLTRVLGSIKNYNAAHDSAVSALQDFSVGVFQIKNLAELISSGQEAQVKTRLELMNYSKSVIKSIVMDLDEKFEHQSKSLSGVPEVMKQANSRLVVASNMPHTKILGESPSGLGADGSSEERNWYDNVKTQQKIVLRPVLDTLIRYIYLSKRGPTGGIVPEGASYEFVPLWQMSDPERAAMELQVAQKDQIYIQTAVLDPHEVALSRYGGEKYSMDTVINEEARLKPEPQAPTEGTGIAKPMTEDPLPVNPAEEEDPGNMVQTPLSGFVARNDESKAGRKLLSIHMEKDGNKTIHKIRDAAGIKDVRKFQSPVEGVSMVYGNIEEDPTKNKDMKATPSVEPSEPDDFEQHNLNMQALWNWEEGAPEKPDGSGNIEPQS